VLIATDHGTVEVWDVPAGRRLSTISTGVVRDWPRTPMLAGNSDGSLVAVGSPPLGRSTSMSSPGSPEHIANSPNECDMVDEVRVLRLTRSATDDVATDLDDLNRFVEQVVTYLGKPADDAPGTD
jgi:hypothetical protein